MRTKSLSENEDFLEHLQHAAFSYFLENANSTTGLIADTTRSKSPSSIAVVGLGLTAYIVGVQRGWMKRKVAAERTLTVLQFFSGCATGTEPDVTGYKGFYYHFLDMKTGLRVWNCELSVIDTALLMAGVLATTTYYTRKNVTENLIRKLANQLYDRVDWNWARNGRETLSQGWKPECGFLHYGWDGYNEGTILYILGLASSHSPLQSKSYNKWAVTYQWENMYGHDFLYAGPLFIHQFSHICIDFRGIQDAFMREKKSDYFENSRRALYIQQNYARLNPLGFKGYDENCWGLSADEGPSDRTVQIHNRERGCYGYAARGVPYGPDDGTLAPSGLAASVPFAPEIVMPALRYISENYPHVIQNGRIPTGFNPSAVNRNGETWVSKGFYGLDQGATLLMIENHRSGFVWELMRRSPLLVKGLKRAGFTGGWLS